MIRRIGVICQDHNSFGFLLGLRDRLRCEAELVEPPGPVGVQKHLTRANAKRAWEFFKTQGVDIVVRFTDADRDLWQEVSRKEWEVFPSEGATVFICGVAVNNTEEWLGLDADYLVRVLSLPRGALDDATARTGRIKSALAQLARGGDDKSAVVARLVRNAPPDVFHRWLRVDEALRHFYTECRNAAARENCETPNELEPAE
ncbi:MAG: hypothetical protein V2A79_08005 [Planctomycetota bacterium]